MKNTHREDKKIINFVFKKSQIFSGHTYLNYQQSNSNCLQLFTLTDVRHTCRLVDDRATINHAINLVFDVMIFNITREPWLKIARLARSAFLDRASNPDLQVDLKVLDSRREWSMM